MIIQQLWRYPVKSLGGEQLTDCAVSATGLDGDRRWGIVDDATGNVLTARRTPELLFASARLVTPEEVEITLPDGRVTRESTVLSDWLKTSVTLQRAGDEGAVCENPLDFEHDADWMSWQG